MIMQMQNLNKIIWLFFICLISLNCTAQKINVNTIVDSYIDYYSQRNKIFTPNKTFLQLGINDAEGNLKEKNLHINNNCFSCNGKIDEKAPVVEYRGYKILIYADNSRNKKILLLNFKNTKKAKRIFLNKGSDNMINDVGRWTFSYDENTKISFFCNSNPMINIGKDMAEIKQKLGIQNVEDCVSTLLNDTK